MSLAEVDYLVLFLLLLVMLITIGKLLNPHCNKNITYYIIKSVECRGCFAELLGALDDSVGVPSRNSPLFTDSCATYLQDLSLSILPTRRGGYV